MFHHLASPLTCWAFSFESGFTVPLSEWAFPWRTWCSCCCVEARSEGSERRPHWQWPPEGQDLHRETPDPRKSEKQATVSVFMTEKQHHPRPMKQATVSAFMTEKQHHPRPMKILKNRPQYQFPWQQSNITPDPWNRPQYQCLGHKSSITLDPWKSEKTGLSTSFSMTANHKNLKNRPQYQFPWHQSSITPDSWKSEKQAVILVSVTEKQIMPRPMKIWKTGHSISFRHSKTDPQKSEKQATVSVSVTAKQTHENLKNRPQYQFPWQQSSITPDPHKSEKQLQHEFLWQQNRLMKIKKNRPQHQFLWQQNRPTNIWKTVHSISFCDSKTASPQTLRYLKNRPQHQLPWEQNRPMKIWKQATASVSMTAKQRHPRPMKQATVAGSMTAKQHHPRPMKQVTASVSGTAKQHHPRPTEIWKTGHSISVWDTKAASPQTHRNLKNRPQFQFLWWQSSITLDSRKSETQGHRVYSFLWQQSIIATTMLSQFEVLFDRSLIICPALICPSKVWCLPPFPPPPAIPINEVLEGLQYLV